MLSSTMVDEGELRAVAQERTAGRAGHREAVSSEACPEAERESASTGGLPIVPYRQLIFTIPRNLRRPFLFDRSLYGDLCQVAYTSTRDFFRLEAQKESIKVKGAVPAMVASSQSFGDLLIMNAHAHAAVSLGVLRKDGIFFPMEDLVSMSGKPRSFARSRGRIEAKSPRKNSAMKCTAGKD